MRTWTRRQAITTWGLGLGAGAVVPLLASCTQEDDPEDLGTAKGEAQAEATDAAGTAEPGDPEAVVATCAVVTELGELELDVLPVVRAGDCCVLTMDLRVTQQPEGDGSLRGRRFEGDATLVSGPVTAEGWAALRLIDGGGSQVRLLATTSDGDPVGRSSASLSEAMESDEAMRLQMLFAAPEDDVTSIGLLLPGWFVPDIPVVDGAAPEIAADGDEEIPDLDALIEQAEVLPVLPLEGYTRQLDGGVEVIESEEKVEIRLAGDVLFDSSSYEVDGRADEVLDAAAATISDYEGGTVAVVGHTDDVGGDAENQTLSENRATAVAEALAERIDTSVHQLITEGRGESEPLIDDASDEARRLNRRVELTLTSRRVERTEVDTSGEVPPFDPGLLGDGQEADAAEGFVRVSRSDVRYRVSAPAARRLDGLLEVTVLAERLEEGSTGEVGYGDTVDLGTGVYSYRGDSTGYSSHNAGFAPRLLVGSTATYPLDYRLGDSAIEGDVEWRNASDTSASDDARPGDTLRFVALYRDLPGVDTVVLEQTAVLGATPFRLTGIPIEG
ncbi:OmpA family protein [Brachybacterium sp. AOP43-C2-M15]|uniref:OmpA family protein n=1 Tax=Brachybacterium sp. AOP43-C2-M15 TaxID=3457661 RepID=UPI00403460FE